MNTFTQFLEARQSQGQIREVAVLFADHNLDVTVFAETVMDVLTQNPERYRDNLTEGFGQAMAGLRGGLGGMFGGVGSGIAQGVRNAGSAVANTGRNVGNAVANAGRNVGNAVANDYNKTKANWQQNARTQQIQYNINALQKMQQGIASLQIQASGPGFDKAFTYIINQLKNALNQ